MNKTEEQDNISNTGGSAAVAVAASKGGGTKKTNGARTVNGNHPAEKALREANIFNPKRGELLTRFGGLTPGMVDQIERSLSPSAGTGVLIRAIESEAPTLIAEANEKRQLEEQATAAADALSDDDARTLIEGRANCDKADVALLRTNGGLRTIVRDALRVHGTIDDALEDAREKAKARATASEAAAERARHRQADAERAAESAKRAAEKRDQEQRARDEEKRAKEEERRAARTREIDDLKHACGDQGWEALREAYYAKWPPTRKFHDAHPEIVDGDILDAVKGGKLEVPVPTGGGNGQAA